LGPLLVLAAILGACSSHSGLPEPIPGAYSGPPIIADIFNGEHLLIASLPGAGYEFMLEGTREGFRVENAFVTLRRPNPAVLYTQAPVQLRLATGLPSRTEVRVYARVVDYAETNEPGFQEALVIQASTANRAPAR